MKKPTVADLSTYTRKEHFYTVLCAVYSVLLSVFVFRDVLFKAGYLIYGDLYSSYTLNQFLFNLFAPGTINELPELSLRLPLYILGTILNLQAALVNTLLFISIISLSTLFIILATKKVFHLLNYPIPKFAQSIFLMVVGFAFVFNQWTTFYILLHPWLVLSISAVPLFFLTFVSELSSKKIRSIIMLAFLFMLIATQIHGLFVLAVVILGFFFIVLKQSKNRISLVKSAGAILLIVALLNSWFLFPWAYAALNGVIQPSQVRSGYVTSQSFFLGWWNRFVEPANFVRFNQAWFHNVDYSLNFFGLEILRKSAEFIQGLLFIVSIFFIATLLKKEKSRVIGYSLFPIALFSLISGGILKNIISQHLDFPLMWLFRNLDKFSGIVIAFLCIFIGVTLLYFLNTNRKKILAIYLCTILVVFSFANWPLLTGNFNGELNTYTLPAEYAQIKHIIGTNNVVVIPNNNFALPTWINNIRYNAVNNPLSNFLHGKSLYLYDSLSPKEQYSDYAQLLGYEYIVISLDSTNNYWNTYSNNLKQDFDNSSTYHLIWKSENEKYFVYKNSASSPLYLTESNSPTEIFHSNFESNEFLKDLNSNPDFSVETTENALHVFTQSTKNNNWSWIKLGPIDVTPNEIVKVINLQKQDKPTKQTHVAIEINTAGKWTRFLSYCGGADGTYDWTQFECTIRIPQDVTMIKLVLNAGWADSNSNSSTFFKDISVEELGTYLLDLNSIQGYSYDMLTTYNAQVKISKPSVLALTESYNPFWEARLYENGNYTSTIKSSQLYSSINGFWIDKTGEFDIVIEYAPQKWFYGGLAASILTLLLCFGFLVHNWRKGDTGVKTSKLNIQNKFTYKSKNAWNRTQKTTGFFSNFNKEKESEKKVGKFAYKRE